MSKKTILPLLFIATAVVAIFAFIVANNKTPQQQDQQQNQINFNNGKEVNTSDWQVYRNEEYGFEIGYPEWWEKTRQTSQLINFEEPTDKPTYFPMYIHIGFFKAVSDDFYERNAGPQSIIVDGIQGRKKIIDDVPGFYTRVLIPFKNQTFLSIKGFSPYEKKDVFNSIFDKLVSTVKFDKE